MKRDVPETHCIVIGSGFGGAVAACRLAQAGFRVTILERGRRYAQGDFPNMPQEGAFLPDTRRWSWKLDQGLWDIVDLEEIVSVQAAGYGGGSLIYANVHLRPPASVFDSAWPKAHQGRKKLDEYFDLAASMLEVEPVNAHPDFQREISKGAELKNAAERLDRQVFHPPLAIRYGRPGVNQYGVKQGSCTGCGACCGGCPQSAKNTLDLNYLAIAERHGARVRTQVEVTDLLETKSGGWIVRCFDHLEARRKTYRAEVVFVCAGAVHSTRLMAGAQFRRKRSGKRTDVKKRVGVGYFPGGDALGIVYQTASPQRPSVGPVISTSVVQWSGTDPSSFFLLQDGGYASPVAKLVGLLRASSWLDRNKLTDFDSRGPTNGSSQAPQRLGNPSVPYASTRAPSCPDDLLRAYVDGAFTKIVPQQLKGIKGILSERISGPLVLPAVVKETIHGAITARWGRLGLLQAPLRFAFMTGLRLALGNETSIAPRAFRALLDGGRLTADELATQVVGYDARNAEHRAVLLAMGRDAALGVLHYDPDQRRLVADLNLVQLTPGYSKQEALMIDVAKELGGELRTNPAWELLRKPVTVHNQGGCRMSDDRRSGVTNAFGKVHGARGLYILDGSILCKSVGVNPSATIAALAERGVHKFIRGYKPRWPKNDKSPGAREYRAQQRQARTWKAQATTFGWDLEPPPPDYARYRVESSTTPIGLQFREESNGYYHPTSSRPRDRAGFLSQENRGRPDFPIQLSLTVRVENLAAFFEDPSHLMQVAGTVDIRLPGRPTTERFTICEGQVRLFVKVAKPYAIDRSDPARIAAQERATRGQYASAREEDPQLRDRLMRYSLPFHDHTGAWWALHGYKQISSTSSLDAWRQTSIVALELSGQDPEYNGALVTRGAGAVHVDLTSFLYEQLPSVTAIGTDDPARAAWAVAEFSTFFFGTLQRIYLPALNSMLQNARARSRLDRYEP